MSVVKSEEKLFYTLEECGDGAFITWEAASQGTLYLVWSKTVVDGSMAHIKTGVPIPAHKYKTNGGKVEICKNIQNSPVLYYEGWCSFIKSGKQFKSTFTLENDRGPKSIQILLRNPSNIIEKVLIGRPYDLTLFTQVGVVPLACTDFNVASMAEHQFSHAVTRNRGAAMAM